MTLPKTKTGKTKDYNLFEMGDFNRPIKSRPDLRESMIRHGFWESCPILVKRKNGKFVIISGHHRFSEAKRLGVAVYYRVVNGDVGEPWEGEGTVVPWSVRDYLHAFIQTGRVDYIELADYIERTGIGISVSIALLCNSGYGSSGAMKRFKCGEFRVSGPQKMAEDMELCCLELGKLQSADVKRVRKSTLFHKALINAMRTPIFDLGRFLSGCRRRQSQVFPRADIDSYLAMIESIHNFGMRGRKPPIAYEAQELARSRVRGRAPGRK